MSSTSDASEDDENWDDEGWHSSTNDDRPQLYKPFFDTTLFSTPREAFDHDTRLTNGAFRFLDIIRSFNLETYSIIQLINYLRSLNGDLEKGFQFCKEIEQSSSGRRIWEDEAYLIPTDPNDPLLFLDHQQMLSETGVEAMMKSGTKDKADSNVEYLQMENLKLRQELEWLKLDSVSRTDIQSILVAKSTEVASTSTQPTTTPPPKCKTSSDKAYFSSYSSDNIHREMLMDKNRTESYQHAIEGSEGRLLKGKTVLDVGCGSGILTLMACRAGAKHVYAVDASDWAAEMTKQNVKENCFEDRVTVLHGKVEDINDSFEAVDVIVSEWMGYALLFESMLDSVLYARDKWLKSDGLLLPDQARLFMAGASRQALDVDYWQDVYGFSMKPIAEDIAKRAQKVPVVHTILKECVLTKPCLIKEFQIASMDKCEVEFTTQFTLVPKIGGESSKEIATVVLWFDVTFRCTTPVITIDTSPYSEETHWGQTVLCLKQPCLGEMTGSISFGREPTTRSLTVVLNTRGSISSIEPAQTQVFSMNVV